MARSAWPRIVTAYGRGCIALSVTPPKGERKRFFLKKEAKTFAYKNTSVGLGWANERSPSPICYWPGCYWYENSIELEPSRVTSEAGLPLLSSISTGNDDVLLPGRKTFLAKFCAWAPEK